MNWSCSYWLPPPTARRRTAGRRGSTASADWRLRSGRWTITLRSLPTSEFAPNPLMILPLSSARARPSCRRIHRRSSRCDAQIRQVAFFDTPDLDLNRSGVVVRARRVQRKPGDSIVKIRPLVPDEVPSAVRKSAAFGVEVDAMPGGFVCSGTMKAEVDDAAVKATMSGRAATSQIAQQGAAGTLLCVRCRTGIQLDELRILGPINVLKVKSSPEGYGRRLVAELLALSRWFSHLGAVHEM